MTNEKLLLAMAEAIAFVYGSVLALNGQFANLEDDRVFNQLTEAIEEKTQQMESPHLRVAIEERVAAVEAYIAIDKEYKRQSLQIEKERMQIAGNHDKLMDRGYKITFGILGVVVLAIVFRGIYLAWWH